MTSQKGKTELLNELAAQLGQCRRCPLWEMATNSVPGEGSVEAEIVFVGEAPGYHEDQQGRPFVGAAGKLLTESLEEIGLSRAEVYITNVLKHRPPGNRDPEPEEIEACQPWLERQLEILSPKLIVTLGRFSMARFIPFGKISQIHGQIRVVGKEVVLPMYHPAAALRSAAVMTAFKADFLKIPQALASWEDLVSQEIQTASTVSAGKPVEDEQQLSLI